MEKKYLYIYPTPIVKEYSLKKQTFYFLYSKEFLQQSYKQKEKQFLINKTAVEIISLFNGSKTYNEIIQYLSQKYSESFDSIEDKVRPFINKLKTQYNYTIKEQLYPNSKEIIKSKYYNYYPTVVTLELTNTCNIRCRHCYGNYGVENKQIMSLDDINTIIPPLGEIGVSILELTGGDPTMNPNTAEAIEKAFDVGISTVMLLTNGIYFSEKLLNTIIKHKDKMYVQIDLHSLSEKYFDWFTNSKNNLQKVKDNIDFLINKGVRVRVCAIITPKNLHEVEAIGEWAYKHGAIGFAASVVTALGRAQITDHDLFFYDPNQLKEFQKQNNRISSKYPGFIQDIEDLEVLNRRNCGAICSQASIRVNGDIKLCNMDNGEYFNLNMGNVINTSIKNVFDKNAEFVDKFLNLQLPSLESNTCKNCEQKLYCTNCLLRGFLGARNMNKEGKKCNWYDKIDPEIKKRFPLNK